MSLKVLNICVTTCVLVAAVHPGLCAAHSRARRAIVKDYFNPTLLSQDQFEKGEDGKFYLKKSAHRSDSEVDYVDIQDSKEEATVGTEILEKVADAAENTGIKEEVGEIVLGKTASSEASAEEVSTKLKAVEKEVTDTPEGKAPFKPVEPKAASPLKPNSKDEISIKPALLPVEEEKPVDEKVLIGETPHIYHRFVPVPNFGVPMLIPIRKVSYGAVSIVPVPPAMDVSDRLPFGTDVLADGEHESASLEEAVDPAEEKKKGDSGTNPFGAFGLPLPLLSLSGLLKEVSENEKVETEKQSKVMDVLGKKFLMKTNVMKVPTGDNSRVFIRMMSLQPVEKADPKVLKAGSAKSKGDEGILEEVEVKESSAKESEIVKDEVFKKELEVVPTVKDEKEKEAEIWKAEATQVKEKILPAIIVEDVIPGGVVRMEEDVKTMEESRMKSEVEQPYAVAEPLESFESVEKRVDEPGTEEIVAEYSSERNLKGESQLRPVEGDIAVKSAEESIGFTDSKKDVGKIEKGDDFFLEKRRKNKDMASMEEGEKSLKKKDKRKRKKCRCEEEESDSEED